MPKVTKIVIPVVDDHTGNDVPQGYLGIKATEKGFQTVDEYGTVKTLAVTDDLPALDEINAISNDKIDTLFE